VKTVTHRYGLAAYHWALTYFLQILTSMTLDDLELQK